MNILIQMNLSNSKGIIILIHGLVLLLVIFVANWFKAIGKRLLILIICSKVAEIVQIEITQLFFIYQVLAKISEYRFFTRQVNSDTPENVLNQLVLIT